MNEKEVNTISQEAEQRLKEPNVILFNPSSDQTPEQSLGITTIHQLIQHGTFKKEVEEFEKLKRASYEEKKKILPSMTLSGVSKSISKDSISNPSNLIFFQFQNLKEGDGDIGNLENLKFNLIEDELVQTVLLFATPAGEGLNWVVSFDHKNGDHYKHFDAITDYVEERYSIGKFINKEARETSFVCFLSDDPHAYLSDSFLPGPFKPDDWLNQIKTGRSELMLNETHKVDSFERVSKVIRWIDEEAADITFEYQHREKIAFALANEFGKGGSPLFHKVCKIHRDYVYQECKAFYEKCCDPEKPNNITIGTFIHFAKIAGYQPENQTVTGALISESVYKELPDFLKKCVFHADGAAERDLLLISSLTALGSAMNMIYTRYMKKRYYPSLMIFIVAKAASGKGVVNATKGLIRPIDDELKMDFKAMLEAFQSKSEKKSNTNTKEPIPKMHILPGNISSSGIFQLLQENDGVGLIIETEADVIINSFGKDYSNYSAEFRQAAEHETISSYRKTEKEYLYIDVPKLATVLSGTPGQIKPLIKTTEDGLLSRMIFYSLPLENKWKSSFDEDDLDLDDYFNELGKEFLPFYKKLKSFDSIRVRISKKQSEAADEFLKEKQNTYFTFEQNSQISGIRRMGIVIRRFAIILTAMRQMEKPEIETEITCTNTDFRIALTIARTLITHMESVHSLITGMKGSQQNVKKQKFYELLFDEFDRSSVKVCANTLNIPISTADKWVAKFVMDNLLEKVEHNLYRKVRR